MSSWRARGALLAGAALLLLAPAASQDRDPESLLPPGFEEPREPDPEPRNEAEPPAPPPAPEPSPTPAAGEALEEVDELEELESPRPLNYFSVPSAAARAIERIGPLAPGRFGLAENAFAGTSGAFLVRLMERLDAPVASRWSSILLRRALLSRTAPPPGVAPSDWVAARADLLVRMGEADAARMLVEAVDREHYTPRFIEAAARTGLASGDIGALCPLVGPAGSRETVWKLAEAMCASLEGEPARAAALIDEARRRGDIPPVDYLLAEKVIGAGAESRRAATIDWDEVDELSAWRAGLAGATGAEIPPALIARADLATQAWLARAPMLPLDQRLGAAWTAAAIGVFSSATLGEIFSLNLDQTDIAEVENTVGDRLRRAWTARQPAERIEAMRTLWRESDDPRQAYARSILTAGAAGRIVPAADHDQDSDELIASLLAAGMDRAAARWGPVVEESGNLRAWALLALGAPRPTTDGLASTVGEFVEADDSPGRRRSRLLAAGLIGLGRLDAAEVPAIAALVGNVPDGRWGRALDSAVRAREQGTVVLLAAVGMQSTEWGAIPPGHLFRVVRALRTVGLDFEARMIAAEALARL